MKPRPCLFAVLLTFAMTGGAHAADVSLPLIGGGGGGQFFARCQVGDILTGFELRTGNDVDAIRPICATPQSPTSTGPRNFYPELSGGQGGNPRQILCPDSLPLVSGLEIGYEGEKTIIVNNVHLYCTVALPNQRTSQFAQAVYDGPSIRVTSGGPFTGGDPVFLNFALENCPPNTVAVGIAGRSGIWVDAVGLMCGDSPLKPTGNGPVHSIGRISPSSTLPAKPICEAARDARARNSPVAAQLEAQCAAYNAQKAATANATANALRPIARANTLANAAKVPVLIGGAAPPPAVRPGADQPPPVPSDLDAMAARGAAIAQSIPIAAELRAQITDENVLRGFDIGMAAYEDQQVPDKLNGAAGQQLDAVGIQGFKIAQTFSITWNRNVDLGVIGAWIAGDDAVLAQARNAEADPFYRLGFDIATGIYGNRKHGARGNTATGPGAAAIRDQMNAAAQRGFNASTALNLSRYLQR
jgi:hypothetical protein